MGRPRYSQDQIIDLLRGASRRLKQGESLASVCKSLGISQSSYHRWRSKYGAALLAASTRQGDNTNHWNRVFWSTFSLIFLITLAYPFAMLWTLPSFSDAFSYMRHDLAWSFHSVFLIPIAFALLATAFNSALFNTWKKLIWILPFIIVLPLLVGGVIKDTQIITTPDRVSSAKGLQNSAIEIDKCLRTRTCDQHDHYISLVPSCLQKYKHPTMILEKVKEKSERQELLAKFEKTHAYLCALLERAGGKIETGVMANVIIGLKMILILFVWSFVYYTIFVASNWFKSIEKRILYTLIGCFVVLVTWFPLQLYAEWYQWYGDLSHVKLFNDALFTLLVVAILLFALFVIWTLVIVRKADFITSIVGVYSALAVIVGIIVGFKPSVVNYIFSRIQDMNAYNFGILAIIFLLYIILMIRLLVMFGMRERTESDIPQMTRDQRER